MNLMYEISLNIKDILKLNHKHGQIQALPVSSYECSLVKEIINNFCTLRDTTLRCRNYKSIKYNFYIKKKH